tara:strand:- start:93 stop:569 length:477 start_codon:yes stop_codon:yes gene_type:complete
MSLSTFDYINKVLEVSADVLEIKYTKESLTSLELFCSDYGGPFIANFLMEETGRTKINSTLDNVTYTINLLIIVTRDYDLTPEQIKKAESDARVIANNYINLIKTSKKGTVDDFRFSGRYREGGYGGAGVNGFITFSIPDQDSKCEYFCNDMIKNIEC